MSWLAYQHYVVAPSSFIEMMCGAMKLMTHNAAVKPGENVVISTDSNKVRIGEALAAAALAVRAKPVIVTIPPSVMGAHGAPLPKPVVAACRESDVFFLPTSWSQTHTDARVEAIKHGSRGATMCEVTEDCLCTGGILADFEENDRVARKLGAILGKTKEVRVRSPMGTEIRGEVTDRPVQYETGLFREPGQFAAPPDSELNISPIEGTAEGKVIADVRIMGIGVLAREPVTLIIKEGEVKDVQGGLAAEQFKQTLEGFKDRTAYNLAEFGIGLNPFCRQYATNLEDLGKLGHAHFGIGSSFAIGGKVRAPCHIDAIIKDAIFEFDGKVVLDKAKLKI